MTFTFVQRLLEKYSFGRVRERPHVCPIECVREYVLSERERERERGKVNRIPEFEMVSEL